MRTSPGETPKASMFLAAALACSLGCGGTSTTITPVSANASGMHTSTSSRISGLPAISFPVAQASSTFQRLHEGVVEALADDMPEATVSSEPAYRRWIENDLAEWLERRGTALRAAENRARSLVNAPDDEKGVGHALVAFLNERTAEDVISAPVPNEAARPERAAALHTAWRERMHAILASAHAHWSACARTLELASPEVSAWKSRCDDESATSNSGADTDPAADVPAATEE